MSDQGPRDGDEQHRLDRDTEPIPRARHEPEPGRRPDPSAADGSDSRDDPFLDEPTPFSDGTGRDEDGRPGPHRRRGAHRDPGDRIDADRGADRGFDRDDVLPDEDELAAAEGRHRRSGSFDDDTVFHDFGDDLNADPGRFRGPSTVGGSFVVGEPLTEEELGGLHGDVAPPLVTSRRVVPLEEAASPLVQRYLFPNENFRGEWRRHPIKLAKEIGIAAGATVIVGLLAGYLARVNAADEISGILVFLWLGVILWAAWKIVDWWFDRFILTSKRVMVVSGVITRNVAMMPLQRVTDMKFVQSALGRVLNYGTFELESAGQDQTLRSIPHLPSPNDLYLRIVEEMYEPEQVAERLANAQDGAGDGT